MTIYLYGATGKLGTAFCHEAAKRGLAVEAAPETDFCDGVPEFPNAFSLAGAVVNCAAMTDVTQCEADNYEAYVVNGLAPTVIAARCYKEGIPFLHVSSDYVFSRKPFGKWVVGEDQEREPCNYYGVSKAVSEEGIRNLMLCDKADLRKLWVVRTCHLFGNSAGKPDIFRRIFDQAAAKGEIEVHDSWHPNLLAPTYAGEAARVMIDILERKPPSGIYNACGAQTTTMHDIACWEAALLAKSQPERFKDIMVKLNNGNPPLGSVQRPCDVLLSCAKLSVIARIDPPGPWSYFAPQYMGELMDGLEP